MEGHELALRVVGAFTAYRDGVTLSAHAVGSRKGRLLLALLAIERDQPVPLDHVVDALWGDAPPRRPANNLATLVSRLRVVFGPSVVVGVRGFYQLGPRVQVDLHDATQLVAEAETRTSDHLALSAAQLAVHILGAGRVLDGEPDAKWAEPARARQAMLLRRARHVAADAALHLGRPQVAMDVAAAAWAADAFDEAACRLLMRAHHAAGEPAHALIAYERLRSTLAAELGIDPAAATRDLFHSILRAH